jgi:hypothetical protein
MSPGGPIVNSLKDAIAEVVEIFESAKSEIVFIVPPSVFSIAGTSYDTVQNTKRFKQNGGVMRGITTVSRANVEETRMRLDIGEDLRHSDLHYEFFMIVGDRQQSLSAMYPDFEEYALDTPIVAYRSEDPTYAEYLIVAFEKAWSEATPAEERIKGLLEQGPPQA